MKNKYFQNDSKLIYLALEKSSKRIEFRALYTVFENYS